MQESRKKEIRIKADSVRRSCKTGKYGIMNLFMECAGLGCKLIRYPLGEALNLGFVMNKDGDTIIFTNTSVRLSREIFTLAHELGHVFLHLPMQGVASFLDDSATISDYSVDEKEQEANYFAASLLMPEEEVSRFLDLELDNYRAEGLKAMDIAKIMSEFSVSFDMALNRLENLGKINAIEKVLLDNERNEKKVGNLLRSVGGNSSLNDASMITDIPSEYIEYAIYNYNHGAIPEETLMAALDCYNLTIEDISDKLVRQEDTDVDLAELIGGLKD